ALQRALRSEPTAPDVAWEAANFYLARGEVDRALPLFRVAMENDPETVPTAIPLCWRATKNASTVIHNALPADKKAYVQFLNFLIGEGELAGANEVWSAIIAGRQNFSTSAALPYLDYLIDKGQVQAAQQVWGELVKREPALEHRDAPDNVLVNGDFEHHIFNAGFGWRHRDISSVEVSIDNSAFHTGSRALRMVFKGPATSNAG